MSAQQEGRLPEQRFSAKAVSGGFWQLTAVTSQAVLQLLVMGVLSRLLSPSDFGLAAVAAVVTGFAAMLSDMGMAAAVVQRPGLSEGDVKLAFLTTLVLGIIISTVVYLASGLVQSVVAMEGVAIVVGVSAFSFLFTSVGTISRALLQRDLLFKRLFIVDILSYGIAYLGIGLPMAAAGYGVWSIVGAALAQSMVQSSLAVKMRPISLRAKASAAMKSMLLFGGGLTLTRIFNYVGSFGPQIVIGRMLGPSMLGTYERVSRIVALPGLYLGNVLENVLFPVMSRVQGDSRRFAEGFYTSMSLIWMLMLPLSLLLCYLTPQIVHILLGPSWPAAIAPLQILFLMVPFRTSVRIMDSLVRAKAAVYRSAFFRFLFAAAAIVGAFVGSSYGIVGVAIGASLSNLFLFLLMLSLSFAVASITPLQLLRAIMPSVVLAIVVAVVIAMFEVLRTFVPVTDVVLLMSCSLTCIFAMILMIRVFPASVGARISSLYQIVSSFRRRPEAPHLLHPENQMHEEGITGVVREGETATGDAV